jgi:hypothetical protein
MHTTYRRRQKRKENFKKKKKKIRTVISYFRNAQLMTGCTGPTQILEGPVQPVNWAFRILEGTVTIWGWGGVPKNTLRKAGRFFT